MRTVSLRLPFQQGLRALPYAHCVAVIVCLLLFMPLLLQVLAGGLAGYF